jgi:hypothetical protein
MGDCTKRQFLGFLAHGIAKRRAVDCPHFLAPPSSAIKQRGVEEILGRITGRQTRFREALSGNAFGRSPG